ncbi:hypothetical protein SDC9_144290 [bioreactor metagenome]|uniref:Uncharacterized protein n=1 Tax=bioreactor metagenome TaxID=1076179 RepID=A0A645E5T6_9ZZZZ
MQGDYIRCLKQCVQRHIIRNFPPAFAFHGVICDDLHAQRLCNSTCGLADSSKSDNTHYFLVQLHERIVPEAEIGVRLPAARMNRLVMMSDMMADFQQQRDCKLSHRRRAIGRDIRHRHPGCFRCGNIYHIIAGREYADVF